MAGTNLANKSLLAGTVLANKRLLAGTVMANNSIPNIIQDYDSKAIERMKAHRGGAHLPLSHALRLPEPTKNTNMRAVSLRFTPVLWPPSDLEVLGRKKKKESLVATMSACACASGF